MVEELLQLLVDVVDTDLLEPVIVKNLKSSDIQDSDIVNLLHCRIDQCFIAFLHLKEKFDPDVHHYILIRLTMILKVRS